MPIRFQEDIELSPDQGFLTLPEDSPLVSRRPLEILQAALRLNSPVVSLLNRGAGLPVPGQTIQKSFDPFAFIPEEKREFADKYYNANTPDEVAAVSRQIDQEMEDRKTLQAGGLLGVAASMGAGLLDPVNLLPVVGTASRGGDLLKNALTTAAVATGTMALTEAELHATQMTRTFGESATSLAGAAFLGGVLGGVGSVWHGAMTQYSRRPFDEIVKGLEQELKLPVVGRFTKEEASQALEAYDTANLTLSEIKKQGLAPTEPAYIDAVLKEEQARTHWEDVVQNLHENDFLEPGSIEIPEEALKLDTSEGAPESRATQQVLLDKLGEEIKDEALIKRLPLINQQDPLIRTMLSNSLETRRIVQQLAETPLKYTKNALGIATRLPVESILKQSKAPLAKALQSMDDLYFKYRLGKVGTAFEKTAVRTGDMFGTPQGILSLEEFKAQIAQAMRRSDSHPVPEVQEAARIFRRDVFDPLKKKAVSLGLLPAGMDPDTAATYLTRVWDIEKINQHYHEFFQVNLKWLQEKELEKPVMQRRSLAELEQVVEQLIERIRGTPEGRLRYHLLGDDPDRVDWLKRKQSGGGMPLGKPLHERIYDIPDERVEGFLENDVEVLAKTYERSMASDLALVEAFGSTDLEEQIRAIQAEYAKKMRASGGVVAAKLKQQMDNDIRDIAAIRDRIRGTFALPRDPDGTFVRAGRVARSLNYLSLMGGVAVSSIPDLGRPMMVHGLGRYLRDGLLPLVTNFKAFRASAEEVKLAGTALDMILDSRAMSLAEVMDDYGRGTRVERLVHSATGSFSKLSGIAQWTSTLKQWSGMMTATRMLEAADAVKAGTVSKKELQNLAASFIDRTMALRIADQFERYGQVEGTVRLPNTERWTDREAVKFFRAGLAKEVDKIIVTPGVGDKPLWLSTEFGKLFGQFKSFFISATQRVLLSGLQDRDLGVLNGLVFSVGLGVLTTLLQAKMSQRPLNLTPEQLVLEGVDRAGVAGWLFELNNMVEKFTRGKLGLSALSGKDPMTRYASRNVVDSLLGPTAGRVEDAARLSGAMATGEWRESDTRAMRRLLPYQNLFYLRRLFDAGEEGLQNTLGVKGRTGAKTE